MHQSLETVHSWTAPMHRWIPKKGLGAVTGSPERPLAYQTLQAARDQESPPSLWRARCLLIYTSWPLQPGSWFNAAGATSLDAPSARGNFWLGGEAEAGPQLSPFSMMYSAELPHDVLSCSRSSSTARFGAHADSTRIHRSAAWHCFPRNTSLGQAVAFSRVFFKATLRLEARYYKPHSFGSVNTSSFPH